MKLLPIQLAPLQPGNARNHEVPLHSPSSTTSSALHGQTVNGNSGNMDHRLFLNHTELLWRYGPLTFSSTAPPSYPPLDFKNHLPTNLGK